jgi:hypothetical protein
VELAFTGEILFWKGPAPWFFVPVPDEESAALQAASSFVSYGWGCIPVTARIGDTEWATSLFPKDERYLVPLKASVHKAELLAEGEAVAVRLTVAG